jgi:hypothetical protein
MEGHGIHIMAYQQSAQARGQEQHIGIWKTFERNLFSPSKIDLAIPPN